MNSYLVDAIGQNSRFVAGGIDVKSHQIVSVVRGIYEVFDVFSGVNNTGLRRLTRCWIVLVQVGTDSDTRGTGVARNYSIGIQIKSRIGDLSRHDVKHALCVRRRVSNGFLSI